MKEENYTELKTEDLLNKKKSLATVTGILAGVLTVLLIMAILLIIKKGFTPLIVVPLALSPILVLNFSQMSAISKELKSRNADQ